MTYPLILDASHYQGTIDPQKVIATGAVGIILKATEQLARGGPLDLSYAINKAACEAAGLFVGAYGFLDPADGKSQADLLLQTAGLDGKTAIAEDLEAAGDTLQEAEDFITEAHDVTGVWGLLYTGNYVLNRIGGHTSKVLGLCPLWLSQPGSVINVPLPWTTWTLWQYGSINVGGVTMDANHFNGSLDDLKELWKMTSPASTITKPEPLLDTNDIVVFTAPGGPVHSLHKPAEIVNVDYSTTSIVNGIEYIQCPNDFWVASFNLPPAPPVVIPPITPPPGGVPLAMWVKGTGSVLNVRISPSSSAANVKVNGVAVQLPDGTEVQATGPALTTPNHYIFVALNWKGVDVVGYASNDYLTTTPPK